MFVTTRDSALQLLAEGRSQADVARLLGRSKGTVAYHARRVIKPDPRFRRRYDWEAVQDYYDAGHSVNECVAHFGFSKKTWHAAKERGEKARASSSPLLPTPETPPRGGPA
jgi:hypothetical protein